ncbi:hypothetical protein HNO88_002707 [Novosphingobium chloroacetimidivorans]|uniref:Uncharacterized protein n=1 Tax=Novosphingobium chloroacetimidivorans TaxID=1428314 RepID=A0A7W7KBY9_9SPHN|nr:hypothetical protein [Novosphingobium chloroacetimidivorans]
MRLAALPVFRQSFFCVFRLMRSIGMRVEGNLLRAYILPPQAERTQVKQLTGAQRQPTFMRLT